MKKLLLAGTAAFLIATAARAAEDDIPPPPSRFQPWQQVWQCNDIHVTITGRDPFSVEYDRRHDLGRKPLHRDQRRALLQQSAVSAIATGRLARNPLSCGPMYPRRWRGCGAVGAALGSCVQLGGADVTGGCGCGAAGALA